MCRGEPGSRWKIYVYLTCSFDCFNRIFILCGLCNDKEKKTNQQRMCECSVACSAHLLMCVNMFSWFLYKIRVNVQLNAKHRPTHFDWNKNPMNVQISRPRVKHDQIPLISRPSQINRCEKLFVVLDVDEWFDAVIKNLLLLNYCKNKKMVFESQFGRNIFFSHFL